MRGEVRREHTRLGTGHSDHGVCRSIRVVGMSLDPYIQPALIRCCVCRRNSESWVRREHHAWERGYVLEPLVWCIPCWNETVLEQEES